jgi:hypothetical protein
MMNIKKALFLKLIIVSFSVILFSACGAKEQKGDDAFERVKAEKLLSNDTSLVDKAMLQESKKVAVVKQKERVDEQTSFKIELEKRFLSNQVAIIDLKKSPGLNAKALKKIARIEQENIALKKQFEVYVEAAKLNWDNFKKGMDRNMDKVDIAVKGLAEKSGKY